MRVLVTDAESKNALAAIRTLGRRGVTVLAGSARRVARGFYSDYCRQVVHYPPPSHEDRFVERVVELARVHSLDVVLPIGDATNRTLSKHLSAVAEAVAVPVAPWASMEIASSKRLTMPFAERCGVGVPRTYSAPAEVDRYPVVVKQSKGSGSVRYVNDTLELDRIDASDAVIQEWVPGDGFGFFALFENGRERATFMHRRLREYPVTGGASTAAVSIYDARLESFGLRLLRGLAWHGVAMVEAIQDARDGQFKLVEINPKFWGSLDLSIAAGVDFPWATVQMALGQLPDEIPPYERGVRFQWVFDDLMHVAARPQSARAFWRDLRDPSVSNEIVRDDRRATLFEAARAAALITHRAARGRLRRPHGEPRAPISPRHRRAQL